MKSVRWKMMDMGGRVSPVLVDAYLRESGKDSTCRVDVRGKTLVMAYLNKLIGLRREPGDMDEKSINRIEEMHKQI